jgi:hypothetical protein
MKRTVCHQIAVDQSPDLIGASPQSMALAPGSEEIGAADAGNAGT